jgi:branched-chain amino acid transport system ATP-binding protein
VLSIRELNVFYGKVQVLRDVSLEVREGEIVSLIGSNAAGKSTVLNSISRLTKVAGGMIFFEGKQVNDLESHEVVELGIVQVPEGRRIFPQMTVKENLQMGNYIRRARGKMNESLGKVYSLFPRLLERKNQLGESLSGGEQQMLAIARGLMAIPRILMLDEPSLGLAPIIVQTIFAVLQQVNKEGVTILLVEQNVQKSLAISNRGYVLENGRIAMEGIGKELLNNSHLKKAYLGI